MSDKFEWTNELIYEFVNFYDEACKKKPTWTSEALEDFKKSKGFATPIEKDFEILSFYCGENSIHKNGIIKRVTGSDNCFYGGGTEGYHLKHHTIHSVRRLSDSEIFTVGDVTNFGRICKWENYTTSMIAKFEGSLRSAHFNNLEKVTPKKILGTTHDGKVCYEGDEFSIYGVDTDLGISFITNTKTCSWVKAVYFFDQKNAQQYALENTIVNVSYKEIVDWVTKEIERDSMQLTKDLIAKFFKSKIQQP